MQLSAKVAAIEFSADEIRVAVVKTGGAHPKVLELHSAPVQVPLSDAWEEGHEALVAAAKSVLAKVKSRPTVYTLCISSAWSVVRQLTIPFKGRRKVAAAVQFELEPYLAFPIDDLSVDYLPVREVDGQSEVLVIGLRREPIEQQMAVLHDAGIVVEGVGVDSIGMTALWRATAGPGSGLHAVLHVRKEGSVVAVAFNKQLAYIRHMPLPAAKYHDTPKAAAREIRNILRVFNAGWGGEDEIESLTITGTEFFDEEEGLFRDEIGLDVEFLNLVSKLKGMDAGAPDGSPQSLNGNTGLEERWAAPIGVATTGAGGPFSLNFLTGELAGSGSSRPILIHAAATALLALFAFSLYFGARAMEHRQNVEQIDAVGQQVWDVLTETFPDADASQSRPAGDIGGFKSLEAIEEALETEQNAGQSFTMDTFSKPTFLELLKELATHMPDDKVSLTSVTVGGARTTQLTIMGDVKSDADFDEVFAGMQSSTLLHVREDPRRRSVGDKRTFTIEATF
jgi:hypothetical protein